MSSRQKMKEAVFAQRAKAVEAANKNHNHEAIPHGVRRNGSNHSKVTRHGNPGRTNVARGK